MSADPTGQMVVAATAIWRTPRRAALMVAGRVFSSYPSRTVDTPRGQEHQHQHIPWVVTHCLAVMMSSHGLLQRSITNASAGHDRGLEKIRPGTPPTPPELSPHVPRSRRGIFTWICTTDEAKTRIASNGSPIPYKIMLAGSKFTPTLG